MGGPLLLDSSIDEDPGFTHAYLGFRPHMNSIMDLEFSSDCFNLSACIEIAQVKDDLLLHEALQNGRAIEPSDLGSWIHRLTRILVSLTPILGSVHT
jgi:hypothetical protein